MSVSASGRIHLTTTLLSTTTSGIAHPIFRNIVGAVRERPVLLTEPLPELFGLLRPLRPRFSLGVADVEKHALVFAEVHRCQRLEHPVLIDCFDLAHRRLLRSIVAPHAPATWALPLVAISCKHS